MAATRPAVLTASFGCPTDGPTAARSVMGPQVAPRLLESDDWTVVPADSKTHRNLMIATLMRHTLQQLDLQYPPDDPALKGLKIV